jgi:hypothetical protein
VNFRGLEIYIVSLPGMNYDRLIVVILFSTSNDVMFFSISKENNVVKFMFYVFQFI